MEKPHTATEMTRSLEDYLECIWLLCRAGKPARVSVIAEELGITRPSVVNGIRQLSHLGYVTHPPYSSVEITEKGMKKARSILARHELLFRFLEALGVPEKTAEADACRIEHVISDDSLAAIRSFLAQNNCSPCAKDELHAQKR